MPSQRLPRRSGLAAVPYRARRRPVPRDLAGPRAATRGRGARRRRGSAEHRLRHRHPCRGRRVRAGGALQLSLAHRPRPALRRSRPRRLPPLQRGRRAGTATPARQPDAMARPRGPGTGERVRRRRHCRHVRARGRGPPCTGRIRRGSSLSTSRRSPSRSRVSSRRRRPARRRWPPSAAPCRLVVVDEAHRFRTARARRYRALAKLVVGARVLLVTATPVHDRIADRFHLLRLFLRDRDLTALGVPSLCRAARGDADPHAVTAAAARLSVSRSRERVQAGYDTGPGALPFPERAAGEAIRVGTAPDVQLQELVTGVAQLEAGGEAAALFRLLLLSQLASSLPAFRTSLARYDAFLELDIAAAAQGRALGRREFRRLFPAGSDDLQLALFPLVLPPGRGAATDRDQDVVRRLRAFAASLTDPKADALARLLEARVGKTIVFVQPRATVHYLMHRLRGHRLAAVTGERGWFGKEPSGGVDVLRAFAPRAQGAPLPPVAVETGRPAAN